MRFITFSTLLLSSLASARPSLRHRQSSGFQLQNGIDAIDLNNQFMSLTPTSSCTSGNACIDGQFAQCVNGYYVLSPCSSGLICAALPLVNSPGTSVTCTTPADLNARVVVTGATDCITPPNVTVTPSPTMTSLTVTPTAPSGSGSTNSSSGQTSLTLLSSVIATNFSQNGLKTNTTVVGEVASLTSTNNFINWCATLPNLPITNGQQLKNGSCNPAPMGAIPSTSNMPSAKFVTPVNFAVIPPNATFQITLTVRNLATGYFVNPDTNYLAAPQQLDPTTGLIQGHAHVVIEALESLNQTTPTDPTQFAFFVALGNKADASGRLYANVTSGLPEGTYKMTTVNAAMNHQPVLLPIAQRGASDDTIYFTVAGASQSTNTTTTVPTQIPQPSQSAITSPVVPTSAPIATQTPGAGNITETC
ncbi:hypothetical protein J3R83DRAFT_6948 [Lanmaoa asiatica]|nr:hypothetical protein J3R83DRAFT_6948 [Lanmaoa asiatica]